MLICNGVRAGGGPMRYHGGNSVLAVDRARFATAALAMGFNVSEATVVAGESVANAYGIPAGVRHPQAWVLPVKGGAIKSYRRAVASVEASANGEMGFPRAAASAVSVSAQAAGGLVASLVSLATITVDSQAAIVATLSSGGTAVITVDASAVIEAQASIAASAAIAVDAHAELMGIGYFTSTTVDTSALTPASIAAAIWDALAADNVTAGTMGELLNTAGSGGLSPTQSDMLRRIFELHGLDPAKPLVVGPTSRVAGDISQTVSEAAGVTTVTRV